MPECSRTPVALIAGVFLLIAHAAGAAEAKRPLGNTPSLRVDMLTSQPAGADLTASECTALGGTVHETASEVCDSKKYCKTEGKGRINRHCLEVES